MSKKKKETPTSVGAVNNTEQVRIRMYNVGFGDCFLLTFPAPDRPRKVLIDCGVHFQGHNEDIDFKKVVARLIEDVKEGADKIPKIDVVIATHRHQDHVLGFENKEWNNVEVAEVWMPWTEDYKNPLAIDILNKQSKKAKSLQAAFAAMLDKSSLFGLGAAKINEIKELKEFSENSLSNDDAMNMLHHGFKGGDAVPRRYLPDKDRLLNTMKTELLPGVTVYAMGPSFDPEVIRDMDPPANEQWFKMIEDIFNNTFRPILPFNSGWSLSEDEADPTETLLSKEDKRAIAEISDNDEFAVAKRLEDSVNGTSLMLMFQVGKAHLFFPGDAQHGTWQSALKDDQWRELLTKTNFYKVGHHGSHNATPKEFVEKVLKKDSGCKGMVSYFPVARFPQIPKENLFTALKKVPVVYASSFKKPTDHDPDGFERAVDDFYVETLISI